MAEPEKLFVRNATGLVRQLSTLDVFTWSIIFFPWLTSWAGIFWVTPGFFQNVNYYASLAVWAVIAMAIILLYSQLTALMPRSGGDYVFISRALASPVGFVASFLFLVAILTSAGSGSYWAFAESGTQLSFAGQVLRDSGMTSLGGLITPWTTSAPWMLMAVGLVILFAGALLISVGGRVFKYVIYGFFAYGAFAMLLVLWIFLSSNHGAFVSAYNTYFPGGVPQVFAQAAGKGYSPGATLANLSAVVPILFISIGPYPVMQFVGGEIRRPKRTLLYGLVLAEVVSILIWFGLTVILDNLVGIPFIEAWTLTVGGGSATVPTAFVTVLNPSNTLLWLIVVGLFIGNIGWSWLSLVFISRLFLAWSFDRVIPSSFAHVSDRFHTPTFAIVVGAVIAIIPMYLEYYTSFITAQVNAVFFYSIVWILAALSAIVLPFARRGVYESITSAPRKGVPILSILGLAGVVLFAYLGYNSVTNAAVGPFSSSAQIFAVAVLVVPIVMYAVSYYYNKKRGIDLSRLHSLIPPE
jgi:amino acid transporter